MARDLAATRRRVIPLSRERATDMRCPPENVTIHTTPTEAARGAETVDLAVLDKNPVGMTLSDTVRCWIFKEVPHLRDDSGFVARTFGVCGRFDFSSVLRIAPKADRLGKTPNHAARDVEFVTDMGSEKGI